MILYPGLARERLLIGGKGSMWGKTGHRSGLLAVGLIVLLAWGGASSYSAAAGAATPEEKGAAWQGTAPTYQLLTDFIAGNPRQATEVGQWVNPEGFRAYVEEIQRLWQRYEKTHLGPMRSWVAAELGGLSSDKITVFYPFSGPDVANMLAFFPNARTYVMLALEPVGTLPLLRPGHNEVFYQSLEYALHELLQFNFFFTEHMASDLRRRELDGVVPLLLFFLGREQLQVKEVTYLLQTPDGQMQAKPAMPGEKFSGPGIPGVKIVFGRGPDAAEQTLYYFSFNVNNTSWRRSPQFSRFLQDLAPFQTFVKAASYLMHKGHYSDIRQFILDQSLVMVQTDEGIPVRYFDPQQWERRFFGVYKQPIALFRNCYQPDLAALYQKQARTPLPFGFGYHHRRHASNLMVAYRLPRLVEEKTP